VNEYSELIKTVARHETDLYLGNGKDNPSITTRLIVIEGAQERQERMTTEKFQKYDSLMNKAVIASLTSAGAVIAFLVKVIFFPHVGN
jgi:hypothetical protein